MLPILALLVAAACVAASIKRLRMALAPTPIDPRPLVDALKGEGSAARAAALCDALAEDQGADAAWERELARAMRETGDARAGRVNELLTELDHTIQSWARVPRVCASIAASSGFLLASVAMREGLSVASDLPLEVQELAVHAAVRDAIDVAALGICGAVFCITVGHYASKAAKARLASTDDLVERLESLVTRPTSASDSDSDPDTASDSDSASNSASAADPGSDPDSAARA